MTGQQQGKYRILVTGSRTWISHDVLSYELGVAIGDACRQGFRLANIVIVHGGCPRGADAMTDRLAKRNGYGTEVHPADWEQFGKSAGFRRNAEMVSQDADVCLAFIRDGSKGATHCAGLAEKAGIPVRRFTNE